jgi:hypothetical protein
MLLLLCMRVWYLSLITNWCCNTRVTSCQPLRWWTLLLKSEEPSCLWRRWRSIFLCYFYLMSRYNHLLACRNDLLLLKPIWGWWDLSISLLIWRRSGQGRILWRNLARNECNVLKLYPLHDSASSTSCLSYCQSSTWGLMMGWTVWVCRLWRMTRICCDTTELDHFLRYDLPLIVSINWALIISCDLGLRWVTNLLLVSGRSLNSWSCRLCIFNRVRRSHHVFLRSVL